MHELGWFLGRWPSKERSYEKCTGDVRLLAMIPRSKLARACGRTPLWCIEVCANCRYAPCSLLCSEPSPEQRLLGLLERIDFRQVASSEEEAGQAPAAGAKEGEPPPRKRARKGAADNTWRWEEAVRQLAAAQEELRVVLDVVERVERVGGAGKAGRSGGFTEGGGVQVASVKGLARAPQELAAELALRIGGKQRTCTVRLSSIHGEALD